MDGAAFSRATTAGESSSDSDTNTNTDMTETAEDTYMSSYEEGIGLSTGDMNVSQGPLDKEGAEGAAQANEVKAQEMGRTGFDASDYVDLSQLFPPSLPSTPLVKEETLSSINHPGTLSKHRHSSATNSPRSNNKRARLEEVSATELDNVISLFKRPRKMSQWDNKPRRFGLDSQHFELAALHDRPTQPTTAPRATDSSVKPYVSPHFDPPRGPRSMSTLPPICFFFYRKGYCNPKKGRRCDYLHDTTTAQQTVSLPYAIDRHDPLCSLLRCPIRLRRAGQVKQEEGLLSSQPELKHDLPTSVHASPSPFFEVADSFLHDPATSIRSQPSGQMTGPPLPRPTGPAKKQITRIEHLQATGGIGAAEAASAVEVIQQRQTKKQKNHKKRAKKKSALVCGAEEMQLLAQRQGVFKQDVDNRSGTLSMQQPLPSLQPLPSMPLADTHARPSMPLVSGQKKRKPRQRNKNKLRSQHAEGLHARGPLDDESAFETTKEVIQHSDAQKPLPGSYTLPQGSSQPVVDNGNLVSKARASHIKEWVGQGPQVWDSSTTQHQRVSSTKIVPYEYPQEALGLSSAERRVHMLAEQQRRKSWNERQEIGRDEVTLRVSRVARDERTALVKSVSSADPRYKHNAGYNGSVDVPSCQRCRDMKEGCDRTNEAVPCLRCNNAGIGAEGCVDWRPDGGSTGSRHKSLVDYELPEGDQRLEWDTDLVRRLFGEIE